MTSVTLQDMRTHVLLLTLVFLGGCSIYTSNGRKLLQNNAYNYAQNLRANFIACGPVETDAKWEPIPMEENPAQVSASNSASDEEYFLQVTDSAQSRSCFFTFPTKDEQQDRIEAAIALSKLHFSLGEFAFSHKLPIKYQ